MSLLLLSDFRNAENIIIIIIKIYISTFNSTSFSIPLPSMSFFTSGFHILLGLPNGLFPFLLGILFSSEQAHTARKTHRNERPRRTYSRSHPQHLGEKLHTNRRHNPEVKRSHPNKRSSARRPTKFRSFQRPDSGCHRDMYPINSIVQLCSKRMGRRQIISSRYTTLRMLDS